MFTLVPSHPVEIHLVEFGYIKSYPVESLVTLQVNKDVKPKVADNKWLQCCLCMPVILVTSSLKMIGTNIISANSWPSP